MKEGSLKNIKDWFIKPLLRWKEDDMSIKDWLEGIFHLKTREIITYKARTEFMMLGLYMMASNKPVAGIGHRKVKQDSELIVRLDHKTPNDIHVEFNGGVGNTENVFLLNQLEWAAVEKFLVENE